MPSKQRQKRKYKKNYYNNRTHAAGEPNSKLNSLVVDPSIAFNQPNGSTEPSTSSNNGLYYILGTN